LAETINEPGSALHEGPRAAPRTASGGFEVDAGRAKGEDHSDEVPRATAALVGRLSGASTIRFRTLICVGFTSLSTRSCALPRRGRRDARNSPPRARPSGLASRLFSRCSAPRSTRRSATSRTNSATTRRRSRASAANSLDGRAGACSRRVARPNLIVVLFDDLGYATSAPTEAAARDASHRPLAAEGAVFDTFYAPAPYCTPSRAGFLTGRGDPHRLTKHRVPARSRREHLQRMTGASTLPADEILLPEALRAAGYATAMVRQVASRDETPSRPNDFGFDHYFGVLHSNDMAPLPLWRNREIATPHRSISACSRRATRTCDRVDRSARGRRSSCTSPQLPAHPPACDTRASGQDGAAPMAT